MLVYVQITNFQTTGNEVKLVTYVPPRESSRMLDRKSFVCSQWFILSSETTASSVDIFQRGYGINILYILI